MFPMLDVQISWRFAVCHMENITIYMVKIKRNSFKNKYGVKIF